jgi:hypothetical protein
LIPTMHLTGGIALGLWSPAPTKKQCLVGAIPCGRPAFDQKSTYGEMHPSLGFQLTEARASLMCSKD